MRKPLYSVLKNGITCFIFFSIACNSKQNTPFPQEESSQGTLETKPLTFSETKNISWTTVPRDSIQPPVTIPLDINKLPENKFVINDFKSFTTPPQEKKLNWAQIQDSIINLDTITKQSLAFKKYPLAKPVITKAGMPKLMMNSSSGIMQFSEEEGLPGVDVSASLIDKEGGIWLAVGRRLIRYAGEQLYIWNFMPRLTTADGGIITDMAIDSMGRMLIGTSFEGFYVMDIEHETYWHYPSKARVSDVICDHTGKIWVASLDQTCVIVDPVDLTAQPVSWPGDLKQTRPVVIMEDRFHNIWLGQKTQISIIDSSRKKVKKIGLEQNMNIDEILELYEDSKGDMWFGSFRNEINVVSLERDTYTTYNHLNGIHAAAFDVVEDNSGKMWICSRDTIFVLNEKKSAFKAIPTNSKILTNHKSDALKDPAGNIWIGTVNNGLLIFDANHLLPQHFDKRNGLVDGNVWGTFEENDGTIWIGTNSGLNIYDPKTTVIRTLSKAQGLHGNDIKTITAISEDEMFAGNIPGFSIINKKKKTLSNYGKAQGFPLVVFNSVADNSGNIWISSAPELMVYNRDSMSLKKLEYAGGLIGAVCYGIMKDRKGDFWVATDSGMMVIDPRMNTVKYLRDKEGLPGEVVLKVMESKSGDIWIATSGGISIINQQKNTITNITAKEGLVPPDIYDLLEKDNKMYAGSSSGLFEISLPDSSKGRNSSENRLRLRNYNKKEGFPYNDYNQMAGMVRRNGEIWLGITPVLTVLTETNSRIDSTPATVQVTGISALDHPLLFDSKTQPVQVLPMNDSLKSANKNWIYTDTSVQAAFLSKSRIRYDSVSSIFKIPVDLSLPHNQNSLSFSFSNPSITGRDKIVYRYILDGEDEQWSAASTRPSTKNYYNLKPGHYTFKVASKGFTGIWSTPAIIQFTIRPPWWLTWWAFILYAIIFGTAAWMVAGYRSRMLKKENRILEEKVTHRTAQLNKSLEELKTTQSQLVQSEKMASLGELTAGIAHEIQNPLNFVNNFSEVSFELLEEMKTELNNNNREDAIAIADDVKTNLEKVIHHGKRADAIVKGMLQHSRGNTGIKEPTDINAMADEYLRLSYQGLRAKDKSFNTHFNTDCDPSIGKINIIPQDIGRVLLNIYNNAFYAVYEKQKALQNGFKPQVNVSTRKKMSVVEITVKDNGNGIPEKVLEKVFQPFFTTKPSGQGTGLGLSLSYDIIKAHGGEIKVNNHPGEGAEFVITLPADSRQ